MTEVFVIRNQLGHYWGKGKAWVFSEGRLVKGTWRKRSDTGPTRVYDADGKEIPLVRGRTFIQVVPTKTKVTVKD